MSRIRTSVDAAGKESAIAPGANDLLSTVDALLGGERDWLADLANVPALLPEHLRDINCPTPANACIVRASRIRKSSGVSESHAFAGRVRPSASSRASRKTRDGFRCVVFQTLRQASQLTTGLERIEGSVGSAGNGNAGKAP